MMNARTFRRLAATGSAVIAFACAAAPAQAQLHINLIDNGGVAGSPAELGFRIAAGYWESVITSNVTINLGVGYSALGTGIIGSTGSTRYQVAAEEVIGALKDVGNSALDASAVLPTLSAATFNDPLFGSLRGISMIRNAAANPDGTGINLAASQYDTSLSINNVRLTATEANLKALGYTGLSSRDANITFSSAFSFDFNPFDGITAGQMDFIGVAIHEIGHALGFTSGVDFYDVNAGVAANFNDYSAGSVLDLFRYSNDPTNVIPKVGAALDWSVGTASYFSLDGGVTQFNGESLFSTGANHGDGRQASHFKDTASGAGGCDGYNQIGIMDPTFCYGEMGVISANDLAAMDAIGWNLNLDILGNKGYTINTKEIYRAATGVPEPTTWGMMLLGFGLVGGFIRRRRDQKAGALLAA